MRFIIYTSKQHTGLCPGNARGYLLLTYLCTVDDGGEGGLTVCFVGIRNNGQ